MAWHASTGIDGCFNAWLQRLQVDWNCMAYGLDGVCSTFGGLHSHRRVFIRHLLKKESEKSIYKLVIHFISFLSAVFQGSQ